jgi:hypothetical protein
MFGACVCSRDHGGGGAPAFALDQTKAKSDLAELSKAAHPFGSARQGEILSWLEARIKEGGASSARQAFTAQVPNPALGLSGPMALTLDKAGANIYGFGTLKDDAPCVVALATHVDTKDIAGISYLGANDSGSSTIALLQQLAYLKSARAKSGGVCDVVGIFFDGEEAVLPNWTDGQTRHPAKIQDNTYGSRYAASQLTACSYEGVKAQCLPAALGAPLAGKPLVAVILMDMIGSPGIQITRDGNSSAKLAEAAAAGAAALGKPELYQSEVKGVEDDHMPFRAAGVPALDLIDFNHLDFWHRDGDDPAHISFESVDGAAKLGVYVALAAAADPKVFLSAAE